MIKNFMMWLYIITGAMVLISIIKLIYSIMHPNSINSNNGSYNLIFLATGLLLGVVAAFFLAKNSFKTTSDTKVDATVLLNKIEKVFKVVTAEGQFAEVFDYSETKNFASLIPSTKKALLIVNAKVLMGFDFKKLKVELNEDTQEMKILEFPKPEILSIEPDIKYYNMEDGLFNKFSNEDLTMLQKEAKQKILSKVDSSELPGIAQKQMQQILLEFGEIEKWKLLGGEKIMLPQSIQN